MNTTLRYEAGQASLTGNRQRNQDRCALVVSDDTVLLALGDGMGGHPRGEVAAQTLIDICSRLLQSTNKPVRNPAALLARILHTAHEGIQLFGQSQEPPVDPRTTAVVVLLQNGSAHWAYAGDSRLYLLRGQQVLTRTTDHSYVERLRQQGIITEQQQESHPQRNYVTRCLGGKGNRPEFTHGSALLEVGDILMLCSDGLWGSLDEESILDGLCNSGMDQATRDLALEATQRAYPESDNVTIIALKVLETGHREQPRPLTPAKPREAADDDLASAVAELQNAILNFEHETKQEKK